MSVVIAAFSADKVAKLTGLSVNQLRQWDRDEFFEPSLAAKNRRLPLSRIYSFEDVVALRTLSMLRKDHKVSRQHLRKAAMGLKRHSGKPWSALTLYVLNREVHFENPTTGDVEGAVSGQLAVPIPLKSVADDMRAKAEEMKRRAPETIGQIERRRHTMGGVPIIAGTRVPVSTVVAFANDGLSPKQIVKQFPILTEKDVEAAVSFDAKTKAA